MTDKDSESQSSEQQEIPTGRPMTEAQRVYLDSLAMQTGEPTPNEQLSEAEASQKIKELRQEAGIISDDMDGDIEIGDDDRSDAV